ncbi:hypothetical protein L0657_19870 [Dyadobacter sp. CY345]|uniref:hypothetical protein n=1 Tax=Dyadobacter sp. CY345 TaxID=2909335 RepID=UPI001F29455F|nr:hypothetical protein [Dyadobacter sp. CY345]MCF2446225.1 hypothetical protein [Dyadobacter sp. CY345]
MHQNDKVSQTNDGTWDKENESNVGEEVSEDQISLNNLEVSDPSNADLAESEESELPDTSNGNIKIANEDEVPIDELTIGIKQITEEIVQIYELRAETVKEEPSTTLPSELNKPVLTLKNSPGLNKLLANEQYIIEKSNQGTIYTPALITKASIPVIRRGTLNLIQGGYGSHKSRLAAMMSICLLKSPDMELDTLGYEKVDEEEVTVIYFDTERNQSEEFAEAVKLIAWGAGFNSAGDIPNFRFTSLKNTAKKDRLKLVQEFISTVRSETKNPIMVVIDVATDLIENFNNPVQSMSLLDYLGFLTDELSVTVLLLIHENPGTSKARGHFGTEAVNKSSYAVRIAYQLNRQGERTDVILLSDVKNRHAENVEPMILQFDEDTKLLKLGDPDFYARWVLNKNKAKPSLEAYLKILAECLLQPLKQQELVVILTKHFNCSENTVKSRLNEIELNNSEMYIEDKIFNLQKISINGKPTTYELLEINSSETT